MTNLYSLPLVFLVWSGIVPYISYRIGNIGLLANIPDQIKETKDHRHLTEGDDSNVEKQARTKVSCTRMYHSEVRPPAPTVAPHPTTRL